MPKTLLIIGAPAMGKTTFAKEYQKRYPHMKLIHTDDYIKHGFENSMYKLLQDVISNLDNNVDTIIEGMGGYRLLRKITQEAAPDVTMIDELYILKTDVNHIINVYKTERDANKIPAVLSMIKGNEKILNECLPNINSQTKIYQNYEPNNTQIG